MADANVPLPIVDEEIMHQIRSGEFLVSMKCRLIGTTAWVEKKFGSAYVDQDDSVLIAFPGDEGAMLFPQPEAEFKEISLAPKPRQLVTHPIPKEHANASAAFDPNTFINDLRRSIGQEVEVKVMLAPGVSFVRPSAHYAPFDFVDVLEKINRGVVPDVIYDAWSTKMARLVDTKRITFVVMQHQTACDVFRGWIFSTCSLVTNNIPFGKSAENIKTGLKALETIIRTWLLQQHSVPQAAKFSEQCDKDYINGKINYNLHRITETKRSRDENFRHGEDRFYNIV